MLIRNFILTFFLLFLQFKVFSDEQFTKKEVQNLVLDAIKYINENGKDKAFAEFNNPKGKFTKGKYGQLYIFSLDFNGILLAHGNKPKLVGLSILNVQDGKGDFPIKKLLKASNSTDGRWIEYNWYNPITKKISKKISFVVKVDDNCMVGAGIYENMEKKFGSDIVLSTFEFMPFTSESMPKGGVLADFVGEIFKVAGVEAKIEFFPFSRAKNEALSGKNIGYFPAYDCDSKKFIKSQPIFQTDLGFLLNKENFFKINNINDLKGKTIGKVKNTFFTMDFDELIKKNVIKIDEASNDFLNISKLLHKRVDAIVIDKLTNSYYQQIIPDLNNTTIFLDQVSAQRNLYVCFVNNSKNTNFINLFNDKLLKNSKEKFYFEYYLFNF